MLCQKCGHFEATVHTEEFVYRQKIEQHLCPLCAGTGDWSPSAEQGDVTIVSVTSRMKRTGRSPLPPLEPAPNGLLAIASYVKRLYASEEPINILSVQKVSDPLLSIIGHPGAPPHLMPHRAADVSVELERSIRDFFTRHGVTPLQIVVPPQISEDPRPYYYYPLPSLPDDATRLIIALLATCFDVREREPLWFRLVQKPLRPSQEK